MALRQFTSAVNGTLRKASKLPTPTQHRNFVTTVVEKPSPTAANGISDKIPYKGDYSREKCDLRREWVEQYTGTPLPDVASWWAEDISPEILRGNIEVPIGMASMPLGIAGPLRIRGNKAQGEFLAPIASLKKNLIADISKGAHALSRSGGVRTSSAHQRMTRCPAILTASPEEAVALGEWAKTKIADIQEEVVSKISRVAKLKEIMTAYDLEVSSRVINISSGYRNFISI